MELSPGFSTDINISTHILKLNKLLYGVCQSSCNWWDLTKSSLETRRYANQSTTYPCVFIGNKPIAMVRMDSCIIFSRKGYGIADNLIKYLKEENLNFDFIHEGDPQQYLGIDIMKHKDGRSNTTQPHLIERCNALVGQDTNINSKTTITTKLMLHKNAEGLERKHSWEYIQTVDMLTYKKCISRPDISMATHQAAIFFNNPKLSHERCIYIVGRYLKVTKDKSVLLNPDSKKGLECYISVVYLVVGTIQIQEILKQ